MKTARMDSLFLLLAGAAIFLLCGLRLKESSGLPVSDFALIYNADRCLLRHVDPYQADFYRRVYQQDTGASDQFVQRPDVAAFLYYPYLPTAFVTLPIAFLPFAAAEKLWLALTAASFLLGTFLMWSAAARHAPALAGILSFLVLAGSAPLLVHGNPAGLVVGLCLLAAWSFLEDRLIALAIPGLALGLLLKPQLAAPVWLYFLLAGGVHRKRALQTLGIAGVLGAFALLPVAHIAPHWRGELQSNLAIIFAHGHAGDPGPASQSSHGMGAIINLQSAFSVLRDDPRFYNPAAYLVCGALLAVWCLASLRARPRRDTAWLALAAISALSMLPVYHRVYDVTLLLLTLPACAMLCAQSGRIARIAVAINAAAFVLTGELQWGVFAGLAQHPPSWVTPPFLTGLEYLVVPVTLLGTALFYLYIYVGRVRASDPAATEPRPLDSSSVLPFSPPPV